MRKVGRRVSELGFARVRSRALGRGGGGCGVRVAMRIATPVAAVVALGIALSVALVVAKIDSARESENAQVTPSFRDNTATPIGGSSPVRSHHPSVAHVMGLVSAAG